MIDFFEESLTGLRIGIEVYQIVALKVVLKPAYLERIHYELSDFVFDQADLLVHPHEVLGHLAPEVAGAVGVNGHDRFLARKVLISEAFVPSVTYSLEIG